MTAMNVDDEPMITVKMCDAFFERYWCDTKKVKSFLKKKDFIKATKREFTNVGP